MLIPNLGFGGAQRVFAEQAKLLAEKFDVVECAFNLDDGHVYCTGNRLVSLDVPAGNNIFFKILFLLKRCWKLYKLKKKEKPAITISHLEGADYVNILSAGSGRKLLVVHGSKLYDDEMNRTFGMLRKKILLPFLYKFSDQIVTVSEGIKDELIQYYHLAPDRITTIYNFFSLEELKEKAAEPLNFPIKGKNTFRLITSGRLALQKNQRTLFYILKALKEKKNNVRVNLFLIGKGPLKQNLLEECKRLGLQIQEVEKEFALDEVDVYFLGYQENPFKFYKYMDAFLLPSAWEGFPMALGEAMALGLPVLASDCPTGPAEFIAPNWRKGNEDISDYPKVTPYGVLLPIPKVEEEGTIHCWEEAVISLHQDKEKRDSFAKHGIVRMQALDKSYIAEKWFEVLKV